jgi:hypothetical protein
MNEQDSRVQGAKDSSEMINKVRHSNPGILESLTPKPK